MKKVLLVLLAAVSLNAPVNASTSYGNSNVIHEEVLYGYSVGYTIENDIILGMDMSMYSAFDDLIPGWYVAYNRDEEKYYYITQDAAQLYTENILKR